MGKTLLISESEVKRCLPMEEIIDSVEKTFIGMGEGTVINPSKVNLDLGEDGTFPHYNGFMNAMPAYIGFTGLAGLKWAGGNLGERKKRNLPYCSSLIFLVDPVVNQFIAVLDGSYITNARTGAQTAVALKYLYNEGKRERKSIRLGIYGAGMQGHMQTLAISKLFDITELRIYDISKEALAKFRVDMADAVKGDIILCDTPQEAAQGDAIICVTQSNDRFLREDWIAPGTIVFPMGSYQEAEDTLLLHADHIIVDHVEQALHRGVLANLSKSGQIGEKDIACTIGALAAGKKALDRKPTDRIVCVPIGTGAMDIACASRVYQKMLAAGDCSSFDFGTSSAQTLAEVPCE